VIVQDLGLLYLLSTYFKSLKIHASTQLTTHNEGQIKFLSELSATRVNLSRELNLDELHTLTRVGHENDVLSEVFVHGSNCLSFSGLCYISSVLEGKSANRGRCNQSCREQYLTTPEGKDFPLNLKDNSAFNDLRALSDAGVDSVKIEGRMKKFHYVYTVVNVWRKLLDNFYSHNQVSGDDTPLYQVFNRDFTNAFLTDNLNKDVFIDNPRDNSALHFHEANKRSADTDIRLTKTELHDIRTGIINKAQAKIALLDVEKNPLKISVSGESGEVLKASITSAEPSIPSFEIFSVSRLVPVQGSRAGLDYESLYQRLAPGDESGHVLGELECEKLQKGLFLPLKELTAIKKSMLFVLNGSTEEIEPIETPRLEELSRLKNKPRLSVLISSKAQLELCSESSADLFFPLPNCFPDDYSALVERFQENRALTPWFPPVLIGKDYTAAVDILDQVKPKRIVTNNTGIAYEAYKKGIAWIAGPYLNIVNSFSLLCLKEKFNCSGSFLSNEMSRKQMMKIITPEDFELFYSIYHPVLLLTSRQCLLHPIEVCDKSIMDDECTLDCNRSSALTNLKDVALYVDKSKGCYHRIYNEHNFLNADIVTDLPDRFSSFFIDLTHVKTATQVELNEPRIIEAFEALLNAEPEAKENLEKAIQPSSNIQYQRGI
jgi:putative protease